MGREDRIKQLLRGDTVTRSLEAPRDRLGQELKPGALVLYTSAVDFIFEVVQVSPIMDPRAPTGLVQLLVRIPENGLVPINVHARQNSLNLIVVGYSQQLSRKEGASESTTAVESGEAGGGSPEPPPPMGPDDPGSRN